MGNPFIESPPVIRVERLAGGFLFTNCYVIFAEGERRAVVIDPRASWASLRRVLETYSLAVEMILLTHTHLDHIMGLSAIRKKTRAPVYCHQGEVLRSSRLKRGYIDADGFLDDGERLQAGRLTGEVLHTPGHTAGGLCFLFGRELFSGDTLFESTVGRTDLAGSDSRALMRSLARLLQLPDETRIYPGHGNMTTIGRERRANPFMIRAAELAELNGKRPAL